MYLKTAKCSDYEDILSKQVYRRNMKIFTCVVFWMVFFGTLIHHGLGHHNTISGNFDFVYNKTFWASLVVNNDDQTAGAIDQKNQMNAYFCGKTGELFMISPTSANIAYLSKKASDKTWVAEKENLKDYFHRIGSLKDLYATVRKYGTEFDAISFPKDIAKNLFSLLSSLSMDFKSNKPDDVYNLALETYRISCPLKPLELNIFTGTKVKTALDFYSTMGMYTGLREFASYVGGYKALEGKSIEVDIDKLMTDDTGVEIIAYLFELWPQKLREEYQLIFDRDYMFFSLLKKLCGDKFTGYGGLIRTVSTIINYIYGKASKDTLMFNLRKYLSEREDIDLEKKWYDSLEKLQATLEKYQLNNKFTYLTETLKDIKEKKWSVRGVNMTEILEILFKLKCSRCGKGWGIEKHIKKIQKKCDKKQ